MALLFMLHCFPRSRLYLQWPMATPSHPGWDQRRTYTSVPYFHTSKSRGRQASGFEGDASVQGRLYSDTRASSKSNSTVASLLSAIERIDRISIFP